MTLSPCRNESCQNFAAHELGSVKYKSYETGEIMSGFTAVGFFLISLFFG